MHLRELIPWRSFFIGTRWSTDQAFTELEKAIDRDKSLFGTGGGSAPFVGDIRRTSEFLFWRRIGYRNSFLPIIRVVLEPSHHGGTRLRVTMRLHLFVMAFMAVWMTGTTVGALLSLAAVFAGRPAGLLAFALPLVGAAITGVPFALEARAAERLLRSIYEDAPALPEPPDTGRAYR